MMYATNTMWAWCVREGRKERKGEERGWLMCLIVCGLTDAGLA
jgi:hypothetical protein